MKIFFDSEFTGLIQGTTLVSWGAISEDGDTFYATLNDYDHTLVDDFLRANVLPHLRLVEDDESFGTIVKYSKGLRHDRSYSINRSQLRIEVEDWLSHFNQPIEMWGDCCAYDWVLFCDLWGCALDVPKWISYMPRDLVTLLNVMGYDPDVSRQEFSGIKGILHNALADAVMIRECYKRVCVELKKQTTQRYEA